MLLHTLLLGLVVGVSATGHPRDETLVPELIAYPSNFANATAPESLVDPRSLIVRQLTCGTGRHVCSDQIHCCPNTSYCATVDGQLGCCPNGLVCNRPPIGSGGCTTSGYVPCPSQDFCCPAGSICHGTALNNPSCETSDFPSLPPPPPPPPPSSPPPPPPPPETTYDSWTSTDTYDSWTSSTSSYIETTSTSISFPRANPTTTTSTKSSNSGSNTFSIKNNPATTSSFQSGNDSLLSNAQNTVPGYAMTGFMFLLVIAGLI